MTAMVSLNGSLTNSCRTVPDGAPDVYGFIITPKRGSMSALGGSQLVPGIDLTVPEGASPSSPFCVCSCTMAPSAVTTTKTALQVSSGDGPSRAVPTVRPRSCCGGGGGGTARKISKSADRRRRCWLRVGAAVGRRGSRTVRSKRWGTTAPGRPIPPGRCCSKDRGTGLRLVAWSPPVVDTVGAVDELGSKSARPRAKG